LSDRILVTYATRAGSTAEVAAAIAETLAPAASCRNALPGC
jgi:menaquinone-dependent protoporphyrinogen IX oxidase